MTTSAMAGDGTNDVKAAVTSVEAAKNADFGLKFDGERKPLERNLTEAELEAEFRTMLAIPSWVLVSDEEPKKRSELVILTTLESPYGRVISVGQNVDFDVLPGDRVMYEVRISLPKHVQDAFPWAKKYGFVHKYKLMGRLPRHAGEKAVAFKGALATAGTQPTLSEEDLALLAQEVAMKGEVDRRWADLGKKFGFDPKDRTVALGDTHGPADAKVG